jgi:hypothetical protein
MSSEFPKIDHILTVSVFLGSVTFSALFFLLPSKDILKYYDLLVLLTSFASILFILASVGRMSISSGHTPSSIFKRLVGLFTISGLVLIFTILSILIAEVNLVLGIIVCIVALTLFIIFEIVSRKSDR